MKNFMKALVITLSIFLLFYVAYRGTQSSNERAVDKQLHLNGHLNGLEVSGTRSTHGGKSDVSTQQNLNSSVLMSELYKKLGLYRKSQLYVKPRRL